MAAGIYQRNPFGNDPVAFFGSAAGPSAADVFGPPNGVLDVNIDGTSMAVSQASADNSMPSGGPFWARREVHALLAMVLGAYIVYQATK